MYANLSSPATRAGPTAGDCPPPVGFPAKQWGGGGGGGGGGLWLMISQWCPKLLHGVVLLLLPPTTSWAHRHLQSHAFVVY